MTRLLNRIPLLALFALIALGSTAAIAQSQTVDPAYQALRAGNVFVDPIAQRQRNIDEAQLQAAALSGPLNDGNPHTRVKIAVWEHLPSPYTDRNTYAHILGDSVHIGNNALIVVVYENPKAGVSIVTQSNALPRAEADSLIRQTKMEILQNPTYGIVDLAGKVASKINGNEYQGAAVLWFIFLVVVIVIGGLIYSASRKRKQQMAAMRGPVDALLNNVLQGIEYLDNYADVLPKNNPDSDQVRINRQAAAAKYDQAKKIVVRATEPSDLNRAQGILDRAQADVAQARRYLDRATGGTGSIPGDDAFRPEPMPENQQQVDSVPQKQRGVSFFSAKPAPIGSLVPVTITVNGQSRQVLVTPEEADELRQGRMPQVRAFQVGGRYIPWYEYNAYDPYRDYWAYENAGWGGFGGGLAAGFIGAELIDSLSAPVYGPYAFATDTAYYQGYNDAVAQQDFGYGDTAGMNFGDGPAGVDNSPYDDTAGVDFGGNSSDNSGDFGGGSDFGGGDFDSGGGDF